jgi:preprotein translocase SecY subunit
MASAAEQMAANMSWSTFGKAKELQQRILFALALLIVYRVGTYIPVPGIDTVQLREFFESAQSGLGGMVNMFTGGAISRMAVFSLGIMPYISASIIVQLLTSMWPRLEQIKKEGEQGRRKINQYTRYGTVLLALFQGYGIAVGLESGGLALDPGWFFRASTVITLVGGTMFLMWLGEQITARGIGNGISLIIFVGIIAELPAALAQFFEAGRTGAISAGVVIGVIIMAVVVIAFVVFMERALRKVHIQYPRRQVGNKMYGGESSHLPIKLNPAGVIPAIFASSLLLLPQTVATSSWPLMCISSRRSASASSASWTLISPISAKPTALPMPVGSIPYSEGKTTVTRIATAATAARIVDLISCAEVGSSSGFGLFPLCIFLFSKMLGDEVAGHLVSHQNESGRHHHDVCGVGMFPEAGCLAPIAHDDQDHRQSY